MLSVLSGAPFGYRFIRKTDHSAAYYEIDEDQARVVRQIFEMYSVQGLSIGTIARLMNEQAIPTCKRRGRWERSTVWGMLRNPAFGVAAELAGRRRFSRGSVGCDTQPAHITRSSSGKTTEGKPQ